jgi:cytochrome c6
LILTIILFTKPAIAANSARGAKIFEVNCAICHAGGGNEIKKAKTLKQDALKKYGMNSVKAIEHQVVHGKKAMPAFGDRLSNSEIEDVAAYILKQAKKGW